MLPRARYRKRQPTFRERGRDPTLIAFLPARPSVDDQVVVRHTFREYERALQRPQTYLRRTVPGEAPYYMERAGEHTYWFHLERGHPRLFVGHVLGQVIMVLGEFTREVVLYARVEHITANRTGTSGFMVLRPMSR